MKLTMRRLFIASALMSFVALSPLGSSALQAEEKKDVGEISVDTFGVGRFRDDNDKSKLQGAIKFRFSIGLTDEIEAVAVAQTGSQFNNAFSSINLNDRDDKSGGMGISHLFLRYRVPLGQGNTFYAEGGALETRKTVGEVTRLYPFGYLDGFRFGGLFPEFGNLSITVANVDPKQGQNNFFERKGMGNNFIEVAFQGELWKGGVFETTVERIEDNKYMRLAVSHQLKDILKRNVRLILEGIRDFESDSFRSGVTIESDLAPGLAEKVAYTLTHRPDEYDGYRIQNLIDHAHIGVKGTSSIVKISNPKLGWYVQARIHHEDSSLNRYDVGYAFKWGGLTKAFQKEESKKEKIRRVIGRVLGH